MDEKCGSAIDLHILLDCGLFGLGCVIREASVQHSECVSHAEEATEFNEGPVHIEH